ncbi:MAG: type II secretion system secretin GspD [Candidatus Binatia bacterium]|nr:type II secretion system secretin GspD [Candidatus Binatia bacterium]MDG2011493.1 type II secretion system secretin GspD [Candidatus Binatia bacterium]
MRIIFLLITALTLGLAGVPSLAPAQETEADGAPIPLGPDDLVRMDFQNVEIPTLVKFISEITGRNFVLDEKIKGRLSLIAPSEITVAEAYRMFQSGLQVKGFTVVDTGPVTKIIQIKNARQSGLPLERRGEVPSDRIVTQILPLEHLDSEAASRLLAPLVSKDGLISAYAPTNSLVVVDSAANIERLFLILEDLDVAGQERTVEVIPLEHAYATDITKILLEAVDTDPQGSTKVKTATAKNRATSKNVGTARLQIIPEIRSNSILVIGNPFEIRHVRTLLQKIDIELPRDTGRIQVFFLKHGDSVELVQVLADLIGISSSSPQRTRMPGRSMTEGGGRFGRGGNSQNSLGRSVISNPSAGSLGGLGGRRAPTASSGRGNSAVAGAGSTEGGFEFEGNIRITADPATNALVISALPQDYETLASVIEQLDIPRKQVLVEAILFEVTLQRGQELGIELQGGAEVLGDKGVLLGRTNYKNLGAVNQALATGDVSGLNAITGALGALVSQQSLLLADGTSIPAGVALVTALQGDSDVNVLSAPNILTTDNEEAEIVVGKNVPFVTSRSTNETNLSNTFSQVDRRDVGITLRITPQITEGDSVRLSVFQEVSDLVDTSETQTLQLGPTTTVRSATTTVVVDHGETVAIGGLISDRVSTTETGVPFLMDIPVLGWLFKSQSKRKEKVNLIILLTPQIVSDAGDMMLVSDEQRSRFHRSMKGGANVRGTSGRLLPRARPRATKARSGGILLPAVPGTAPVGATSAGRSPS